MRYSPKDSENHFVSFGSLSGPLKAIPVRKEVNHLLSGPENTLLVPGRNQKIKSITSSIVLT